jgi:putative glycosyltransferase (TIGR04372 family)
MRPFRTQHGSIDLASFGDTDFKLQLYAISRARFVLASASGPGICGSCFGTPTGMCNDPVDHGVWNKQDAKMSNHIIAPDNRRISHELAVSREMYFTSAFKHLQKSGFRIAFQSTEEVKRLSNLMYDRTTDTPRWRDHWYTREQKTRPNEAPLPTDPIHRETFVDFPDLAPGDGTIDLPANP